MFRTAKYRPELPTQGVIDLDPARAWAVGFVHGYKLKGHDPHVYLKDVMDKLPSWPDSRILELLPRRWQMPAQH